MGGDAGMRVLLLVPNGAVQTCSLLKDSEKILPGPKAKEIRTKMMNIKIRSLINVVCRIDIVTSNDMQWHILDLTITVVPIRP